jgi:hypothetical protein
MLAQPAFPRLPFVAAAAYGDGRSGERIAGEIVQFLARQHDLMPPIAATA